MKIKVGDIVVISVGEIANSALTWTSDVNQAHRFARGSSDTNAEPFAVLRVERIANPGRERED